MAFATPRLTKRPNSQRLLFYSSKSTGCPEGEAASPWWRDTLVAVG